VFLSQFAIFRGQLVGCQGFAFGYGIYEEAGGRADVVEVVGDGRILLVKDIVPVVCETGAKAPFCFTDVLHGAKVALDTIYYIFRGTVQGVLDGDVAELKIYRVL